MDVHDYKRLLVIVGPVLFVLVCSRPLGTIERPAIRPVVEATVSRCHILRAILELR